MKKYLLFPIFVAFALSVVAQAPPQSADDIMKEALGTAVKENLENPGALEMLTKYEGADTGIPYWLVFDKNGSLLADSRMPPPEATPNAKPLNTGCPANKEEVDYFLTVLRKTTPLSESDLEIVRVRFRKNNPN
jgi:hypothetical protein